MCGYWAYTCTCIHACVFAPLVQSYTMIILYAKLSTVLMCSSLPSLGSLWCGAVSLAHAAISREGRGSGTSSMRRVARVIAVSNLDGQTQRRRGKERRERVKE